MFELLFDKAWKKKAWIIWGIFAGISIIYAMIASKLGQNLYGTNFGLCISYVSFVIVLMCTLTTVSLKSKLTWLFVCFVMACGFWFGLSYTSYYSGVRTSTFHTANYLYSSIETILSHDMSDEERRNSIIHAFEGLDGDKKTYVAVKKNGEIYVEKDYGNKESGYGEKPELRDKYIKEYAGQSFPTDAREEWMPFPLIYKGNDVYEVVYEFYNKPYQHIGITRAITVSLSEDATGAHFTTAGNYQRSVNFVIPFIFLLMLTLISTAFTNQIKAKNDEITVLFDEKVKLSCELAQRNRELEENYAEIEAQKDTLEEQNVKIQGQVCEITSLLKEKDKLNIELEERNENLKKSYNEIEIQKDKLQRQNEEIIENNKQLRKFKEMLEAKNSEITESIRQLHIFENTFYKIKRDYEGIVSNSKNNLQHMQSTWDAMEKNIAGSSRHDAINRIRSLKNTKIDDIKGNLYYKERVDAFKNLLRIVGKEEGEDLIADTYDFLLSPWVEKIKQELKGLDATLDMAPVKWKVRHIVDSIKVPDAIPEGMAYNEWITFTKRINDQIDYEATCNVIPSKLQSVVFNLIENSSKATQELVMNAADGVDYEGRINLEIYEGKFENTRCLCIKVTDNGGGFPDDVISSVYREPIPTTKDDRKFGEGTSYIGFFVDLMQGRITARNVSNDYGKGAETIVYLPYVEC